ncbi:DUF2935 domain-containing protein [Paenibacillus gansuensis]|uniref:DUF2935 domain-containing protein n=1 Tax=Paenibacillus gansuensis TaxID=306542 RepID=A0ABW5P7W1_9BACL
MSLPAYTFIGEFLLGKAGTTINGAASYINPWEEHRFWLEILEDHAIFVFDQLSPAETSYVQTAEQYIMAFRNLRSRLNTIDPASKEDNPGLVELAKEAYPVALGYFRFEGDLQRLRILDQVNINLTPTYFNGTLNENQEYLRLLTYYMEGLQPEQLPLNGLLDLWLEDQVGHAVLLRNVLDPIELGLTEQANNYSRIFQAHLLKNDAFKGYLRFIQPGFEAEKQLAVETAVTVVEFYEFVVRVIRLYRGTRVLSRTTLRFLEHHLPESCYFLKKLSAFDDSIQTIPDCSLHKPSFPH